eukprot:scaffold1724_cov341-Pavlova_lutheri.AAC.83
MVHLVLSEVIRPPFRSQVQAIDTSVRTIDILSQFCRYRSRALPIPPRPFDRYVFHFWSIGWTSWIDISRWVDRYLRAGSSIRDEPRRDGRRWRAVAAARGGEKAAPEDDRSVQTCLGRGPGDTGAGRCHGGGAPAPNAPDRRRATPPRRDGGSRGRVRIAATLPDQVFRLLLLL